MLIIDKTFLFLGKRFIIDHHNTLTDAGASAILATRHMNIHQEIEVAGGDERNGGLNPDEVAVSIPAEISCAIRRTSGWAKRENRLDCRSNAERYDSGFNY